MQGTRRGLWSRLAEATPAPGSAEGPPTGGVRGHSAEVRTLLLNDPQGRTPAKVLSEGPTMKL